VEPVEVDASRALEAVDDDVGSPAEHAWAQHVQERAHDGGDEDDDEDRSLGPQQLPQPADGQAELVRPLGGHAGRVPAAGGSGVGRGEVDLRGVVVRPLVGDRHAALRSPICDCTISA
jgi:hypothetical protein